MARILLSCWGSHGDVDPFLGLGIALRRRGHSVALATMEYFRPTVIAAGLDFFPLRPRIDPTEVDVVRKIVDRYRGGEFLLKELLFPQIQSAFEDLSVAADGADLLVSHPITFAAPIVAASRNLPWASAVLAPTSFFSTYDVPAVPPLPWLKELQRLGHWPGRLIVSMVRRATASWPDPAYALRQRLGLPRGGQPIFEGQHSPSLVLALYSRVLGQPQPDWPDNVVITGHVFHDAPHGTSLSPELDAFIEAGAPPVVFTLGSSLVLVAGRFWRESIDAVRRIGARAVLLVGPDQIAALRPLLGPDVMAVERAPHSLLFPRAAVVVQPCGIGTLAQSLRSGRPMLAVPHAHDQPDNAWRARHLGMARVVSPARYRGARVAAALRALQGDPSYASAAGRVAQIVRSEGGVETACDALEQTFFRRPA